MTTSFDLNAFNQAIIDEFRSNDGRVGGSYPFSGRPMVVLHHRGARTGTERVTPLAYEPDGEGSMLIFGTMGGSPTDPAWCHNLRAHPRVDVEVGRQRVAVEAVELVGAEREAAWTIVRAARPSAREGGGEGSPAPPARASASTSRSPPGSSRCSGSSRSRSSPPGGTGHGDPATGVGPSVGWGA
jgi:deazaflavin-dependent oxidoreductase (nitroreductase family)